MKTDKKIEKNRYFKAPNVPIENELRIKITPLRKEDKKMAELFQAYYELNLRRLENDKN